MRRLWKVVKILVVVLVVLIVAAVVAVNVIDPNQFKDTIAERAKDATGRDLAIAGDIDFSLGLNARVSVAGVSLSNPQWAAAANMLDVQQFEAEIAVLPLITGNIEVNRLVLSGATINLERDAQGQVNWQFGDDTAAAGDDAGDDSDDRGEVAEVNLPVVRNVLIENVNLNFADAVTGQTQQVTLARLALRGDGPDAPLTLDLTAVWNALEIAAQGEIGALADFGDAPLPIDLTAQALGFDVAISGTVDQPTAPEAINLALTVAAADLSGLAAVAGDAPLPTAGPLDLSANIAGGPAGVSLTDLALAFGATDLAGEISVDLTGPRPSVVANLTSTRIDLAELAPPAAEDAAAPAAADAAAEPDAAPSGKVFPDDPLPLARLRAADADISIAVAQLITPTALSLEDIQVKIGLADGALNIDPLSMSVAGTALGGTIALADTGGVADLNIDISAPTLDIGRLVQEAAGLEILRGSGALDIELASSGASVAALMAGLNGHTTVLMNEGQMKTEGFDLIVGGLSSVLGSLFSEKQEWTVLSCLAANLQFTDGIAETAMLVDTDVIVVTGAGQLDFAQETNDLTITPNSKSATLSVALPINVRGTFADPSFAPDELAAAKTIGSLLGSTLFPPAALLAFGDLGSEDSACINDAATGAAATDAPSSGNPVDAVTDTVGDVLEGGAEGVGNAVEGIGRGIRGLLGGGN